MNNPVNMEPMPIKPRNGRGEAVCGRRELAEAPRDWPAVPAASLDEPDWLPLPASEELPWEPLAPMPLELPLVLEPIELPVEPDPVDPELVEPLPEFVIDVSG